MNNLIIRSLLLSCMFLVGCVSHPQTAEEFRVAVPGAFMGKVETFEVDRSFSTISNTMKRKAPECLDVTIKTTSQTTTSYQVIVTNYNPTVIVTDQRAELHLQQVHEQGVMNVSKVPENGYYLLVMDATPISGNKTRIDMYRPSIGFDVLIKALKGWSTGDNVGCPDLTKI